MAHNGPLESSRHLTSNRQPSAWQLGIFHSANHACARTHTHTHTHTHLSLIYMFPLSFNSTFPPARAHSDSRALLLTPILSLFLSLSFSLSLSQYQSVSRSITRFPAAGHGIYKEPDEMKRRSGPRRCGGRGSVVGHQRPRGWRNRYVREERNRYVSEERNRYVREERNRYVREERNRYVREERRTQGSRLMFSYCFFLCAQFKANTCTPLL